ncbi:hypothetical protein L798_15417 [Zootermopsis nevadensis]|uniref:Uncharacterized protein n=1 Tax=Zootermopsis nevadensis TaxID=136037 RepID=A0A067QMH5_ZOONE|nr:hypothetical protein L798_15417 [Zootermopsis nevadensis]
MSVCSGMLAALLYIVVTSGGLLGGAETSSDSAPINVTFQKEEQSYEANWVIMDQPRCCSDCTYVAAGFKCKVKSCLQNCPWARSAASPTALPMF